MIWVRRLAVFALAFALGVMAGPLLSAVLAGLSPIKDKAVPLAGAMRLLEAYEARVPSHDQPAGISWSAVARACGYDPATVMEVEVPAGTEWTPYLGYFDLRMWQGSEARADLRAAEAERLAAAFTPFELGFLRVCLDGTVLAGRCEARVAAALAGAHGQVPLTALPPLRSRETICHYLDGVAARRGRPLAARDSVATPRLPGSTEAPVASGP